jgi:riboflavin synthase
MFTGIIEAQGVVLNIEAHLDNLNFTFSAPFLNALKVDQSLAHNGVCLTVVALSEHSYTVTAISETLQKTNLGKIKIGDKVNLERSMVLNGRLDGHIVQGHVDQTGVCTAIEAAGGSWIFTFEYDAFAFKNVTVNKGSICINGVSLTVARSFQNGFSVAIIPYTYEQTTFNLLKVNDLVNLEFDIIGKYVSRYAQVYSEK